MSARHWRPTVGVAAAVLSLGLSAAAQGVPQGIGVGCVPVGQRTQQFGCFILAAQPVGAIDRGAAFWRLETFPDRAAAERARARREQVVEAFGKVWRLTIAGRAGRRSAGGSASPRSVHCRSRLAPPTRRITGGGVPPGYEVRRASPLWS